LTFVLVNETGIPDVSMVFSYVGNYSFQGYSMLAPPVAGCMVDEFMAVSGEFFFFDHDYETGDIIGFSAPGMFFAEYFKKQA
jgi:hypothetical protein